MGEAPFPFKRTASARGRPGMLEIGRSSLAERMGEEVETKGLRSRCFSARTPTAEHALGYGHTEKT